MKRDGTPETELEKWLLDMGLGFSYALSSESDLTKAQMDVLAESTPDPEYNPRHNWLLEELQSHAKGESRAE